MHFTSEALKGLESDITDFTVEQGLTLTKASVEYLKTTREAIKRTLSRMPPGSSVAFSFPEASEGAAVALKWLQGWKDRAGRDANESISESSHGRQEGSQSRKRGRDETVPEPAPKRSRPSAHRLLDFHVKLLLNSLEGHAEAADAVLLLQDSLTIVNAGAKSQIAQWHLKRVKGMVPDNVEISDAVDMLSECISYKDKL